MLEKDMVVLVTGAAGGAGKAVAEAYLNAGASVYAGDIRLPEWNTAHENRLIRVAFDVTDETAVARVIEQAEADKGGINVLINNAGITIGGPVESYTLETWNKVMAVNATGTFLCTREVVKRLLKRGKEGRIINIASIAGKNAFPGSPAYCASKAAVIGFTRSLAVELAPKGIHVNAICPGSLDTEMIQDVIESIAAGSGRDKADVRASMEKSIPTGRFQAPQEVAALCLFLSSDSAKSINGEAINLDGGVVRD